MLQKEPPFAFFNVPKMSEFIWNKLLSEKQTITNQLRGLMLLTVLFNFPHLFILALRTFGECNKQHTY